MPNMLHALQSRPSLGIVFVTRFRELFDQDE